MMPKTSRPLAVLCCLLMSAACRADPSTLELLHDFPTTRVTIVSASGPHNINAWLADTPEHRARGLMFVRNLPAQTGMLFVYAPEQEHYVSMWMKNTYIPLDMAFIDRSGRIVNIAENTKPLTLDVIGSVVPVVAVLELPAGTARRLQLRRGDQVRGTAFPL
ncbi:MAG: DUF192 domain-containing protein [Steroidobacteraceae bacterium]